MKRVIFIFAAILVLAGIYQFWVRKDMSDFSVCYKAGERIIQGETIYRESDGHMQYKYSPPSALFFSAFSFLPYDWARLFWYILEFLFLLGIFILSFKILPVPEKKAAAACLWTFLILLKFLGREVELGQVNLFILFILTLMLYSLLEEKESISGLFWGISLFFKPYALVFLPYFLIKRKYRITGVGLALFLFGLALPALFYGLPGNLLVLEEWPANLSHSTASLLSVYDNASLYGFLLKAFPASWRLEAQIILALALLFLGSVVLWMIKISRAIQKSQRPEVLEGAFLFIMIPLFSPLGWYYNYLYSILAVMLIVNALRKFPRALRIILIINFAMIGTSLVEIWGRKLFHFYTQYSLVVVNYFVVFFGLFYLRHKKIS